MKRVIKAVAAASVAAIALTGCTASEIKQTGNFIDSITDWLSSQESSKPVVEEPVAINSDAPVAQQLSELRISEPQQNMHLYTGNRNELFPHWNPVSTAYGWTEEDLGTSCNTKWYSMWRDSTTQEWYDREKCILGESTAWVDPYGYYDEDGKLVIVASDNPADFQNDHIVSVADGFRTGAEQMTVEERTSLANDPLNIVTSGSKSNNLKSDSTPETLLVDGDWYSITEEGGFRCEYAQRYIQVKHKYGLTITQGDFNALANTLNNECSL